MRQSVQGSEIILPEAAQVRYMIVGIMCYFLRVKKSGKYCGRVADVGEVAGQGLPVLFVPVFGGMGVIHIFSFII